MRKKKKMMRRGKLTFQDRVKKYGLKNTKDSHYKYLISKILFLQPTMGIKNKTFLLLTFWALQNFSFPIISLFPPLQKKVISFIPQMQKKLTQYSAAVCVWVMKAK
ncbi:hypothetical protein M9H77_25112 [Catharanthus roseus]|uniref:Uncharacterized protein n=1 Tax=Catharanthus roseus TaxID=4058 RepID=A0ACC0A676_CATRO|nr:hypothetical protein M9H77_25112 [Catharanthus roseus]